MLRYDWKKNKIKCIEREDNRLDGIWAIEGYENLKECGSFVEGRWHNQTVLKIVNKLLRPFRHQRLSYLHSKTLPLYKDKVLVGSQEEEAGLTPFKAYFSLEPSNAQKDKEMDRPKIPLLHKK